MNIASKNKAAQLGMPIGTASARLKKSIMLYLLQQLKQDICYRCSKKIQFPEQLSVDHKQNWLNVSSDLFWDLDNIAFSHISCNIQADTNNYDWDKVRTLRKLGYTWRQIRSELGISMTMLAKARKQGKFE